MRRSRSGFVSFITGWSLPRIEMTKLVVSVMPPLIGSASIGLTNAQNILRYARLADDHGFEAILLQDHIGIEGAETMTAS